MGLNCYFVFKQKKEGNHVLGAVQRKNSKKSEITMEVGGWVQVSLGFFLKIIPKYHQTSTDIILE